MAAFVLWKFCTIPKGAQILLLTKVSSYKLLPTKKMYKKNMLTIE